MVFQSIFAQMMVAHIRLEVSVWTTNGSFLSAHFFPQHLTVTSMSNVLHRLDLSNTSSNIFRKVLTSHPLKSMTEMKLRGTWKVIILAHWKQATVSINSTLHGQVPSVVRLQIHLPGQHMVTFDPNENIDTILARASHERMTLSAYFEANANSGELGVEA